MGRISTKEQFTGKAANGVIYNIRFAQDAWAAYGPNSTEVETIKAAHTSLRALRQFLGITNLKEVKQTKTPVTA